MPIYNNSKSELRTRTTFKEADCVCFDVDSTVCEDEAIDELARFANREKEVAAITALAMQGRMTFREALMKRLELIRPNVQMMKDYLKTHPPRLTPGVKELIELLHRKGVEVYLISGGFDTIIEPVAEDLNIPIENIYANTIKFKFSGDYAGFDENQPTSNQDGKARVISYLRKKHGYNSIIMIGDGSTDLAACPPADAFIGFGGNVIRDSIRNKASWYVTSFNELTEELKES